MGFKRKLFVGFTVIMLIMILEQIAAIEEISAVSAPLLTMTENLNEMIKYFKV